MTDVPKELPPQPKPTGETGGQPATQPEQVDGTPYTGVPKTTFLDQWHKRPENEGGRQIEVLDGAFKKLTPDEIAAVGRSFNDWLVKRAEAARTDTAEPPQDPTVGEPQKQ